MDRSLDEVISERQRPAPRGRNRGTHGGGSRLRDSYRKPEHDLRDPDDDHWVHDRFEGDRFSNREPREYRSRRDDRIDRYEPETGRARSVESSAKIRVDQLHYDLTEQDLRELFTRKGPISRVELLYDRAGRSQGIAYVTYTSERDADRAIRDFDGATALGQTIKLTLVPTGPSTAGRGRALGFGARTGASAGRDSGRSLFDRIETRRRSESPRRATFPKPAPDNVDRYVPSDSRTRRRSSRSRSPNRGRRGGRGARGGPRRDTQGRPMVGGRPRMTANELDAEMEDYWGNGGKAANGGLQEKSAAVTTTESAEAAVVSAGPGDGDIDMIE